MLHRILVSVDRILDLAPDVEVAGMLHRELCTLADDLNSELDYDVELTHADTGNFLAFSIGTVDPGVLAFREDLVDLAHIDLQGGVNYLIGGERE